MVRLRTAALPSRPLLQLVRHACHLYRFPHSKSLHLHSSPRLLLSSLVCLNLWCRCWLTPLPLVSSFPRQALRRTTTSALPAAGARRVPRHGLRRRRRRLLVANLANAGFYVLSSTMRTEPPRFCHVGFVRSRSSGVLCLRACEFPRGHPIAIATMCPMLLFARIRIATSRRPGPLGPRQTTICTSQGGRRVFVFGAFSNL